MCISKTYPPAQLHRLEYLPAGRIPDATDAAKQKAEQLGVDLSGMEGSGAEGRITVKDVLNAARR